MGRCGSVAPGFSGAASPSAAGSESLSSAGGFWLSIPLSDWAGPSRGDLFTGRSRNPHPRTWPEPGPLPDLQPPERAQPPPTRGGLGRPRTVNPGRSGVLGVGRARETQASLNLSPARRPGLFSPHTGRDPETCGGGDPRAARGRVSLRGGGRVRMAMH